MKRRSRASLFWYPFTLLVMLCLLSALCWLLYYLVQADPFSMGPFFAFLMTALQLYLMWRMVRWGKKKSRLYTSSTRLRALPFLYRRKSGRSHPHTSTEARQYTH